MKGNMIFKTTKPSPNSGYTALAYAFAQIGSLRSPTSYVRKTIEEIKSVLNLNNESVNICLE